MSAPSITPSPSVSKAPLPDSTTSLIPSPSESKSNESIIPSPSVSNVGSPFCSTKSGIPSLSSSKSILSGIPSPSLSAWTVIVTVSVLQTFKPFFILQTV